MRTGFTLTGSHVWVIVAGFFLTIFAANAIFITLAIRSFPGEQEKKSYLQGLAYNAHLEALAAQKALGWTVQLGEDRLDDGRVVISLAISSKTGEPVTGLDVVGFLGRAVDDDADRSFALVERLPGRYDASIDGIAAGNWRFTASAQSEETASFKIEKRLLIK